MVSVKQVADIVNGFAPFDTQWDADNCGINIDCKKPTDKILAALDVTEQTVAQAVSLGCGIIVSHHPLFYSGVKHLTADDVEFMAVQNNVSVIAAHTCWDFADGGVNDLLADILNLTDVTKGEGGARIGSLPAQMTAKQLAEYVKKALSSQNVMYVDGGNRIKRIALVGGQAGFMMKDFIGSEVDAYLTGELSYHAALTARRAGFSAVAAGHHETEAPSVEVLAQKIRERCDAQVFVAQESPVLIQI